MQVIAILLIAFGFCAAVASSGWAAALCFVLFPLQQLLWASSALFLSIRTLPNYLVAAAVGLGLCRQWMQNPGSLAHVVNPVSIGSLALYAWAAFSLAWTPSVAFGTSIVMQGYPYVILMIVLVPITMGNLSMITAFRRGLMWMGTATLLAILVSPDFSYWSGRLVYQFSSEERTNPLAIGELGGMIFMAAVLAAPGRQRARELVARGFVIVVGLLAMLQSGARGQVVFAVGICVLVLPIARPIANLFRLFALGITSMILVMLVPVLASFVLSAQSLERWDTSDLGDATEGRFANIRDALMAWSKAPIAWVTGLGANAFTSVSTAAKEGWIHNLTTELLVEYGLIGFGLFLIVLLLTIRDIRWLYTRVRGDPEQRANLGFLTAVLGFELLLAQKQGNLWGDIWVFGVMCMIARTRRVTQAQDMAADYVQPELDHDEWEPGLSAAAESD